MKTIALTQGKVAFVDDEDYDWLNQFNWFAVKIRCKNNRFNWYSARQSSRTNGKQRMIFMHREILGITDSRDTDHRDNNGLNNQRYNIRPATRVENRRNQPKRGGNSRFKGVCWHKRDHRWRSQITVNGRVQHLGYFTDDVMAALAYDDAARQHFGEFALTNF